MKKSKEQKKLPVSRGKKEYPQGKKHGPKKGTGVRLHLEHKYLNTGNSTGQKPPERATEQHQAPWQQTNPSGPPAGRRPTIKETPGKKKKKSIGHECKAKKPGGVVKSKKERENHSQEKKPKKVLPLTNKMLSPGPQKG